MVADNEEDRDALGGEPGDAFGELTLVRLAWVAALVRVAAEQRQVHPLGHGALDHIVQRGKEVTQPGRQPRLGVRPAVVLYAYVDVGEV